MDIYRHIGDRNLSVTRSIVTLGNFDGIHLGHQALLHNTVEEAKREKCRSVVLTFEPHPLKVLAPERAPHLILTHKDKMQLLQSFGVDVVLIQAFDNRFANLEAEDFVRQFLVERLQIRKIWVGRDLRFGKGRKGRVDDLVRWGVNGGFEVGVVEPILLQGVRVSSSRIRTLIEHGQLEQVEPLLGRYHFISGRVISGHRRGRELGFPTANTQSRTEVLPPDGIYATLFQVDERRWPSVTNIGVNPTFGDGPRTVETFIMNFDGELYGESVKLFFVKRIREEKKFLAPGLLIDQMKRDVIQARQILTDLGLADSTGLSR